VDSIVLSKAFAPILTMFMFSDKVESLCAEFDWTRPLDELVRLLLFLISRSRAFSLQNGIYITEEYVLYWTGVRYNLHAMVLTWDDTLTVSINSKTQFELSENHSSYHLYLRFMERGDGITPKSQRSLGIVLKSSLNALWQLWEHSLSKRKTTSRPSSPFSVFSIRCARFLDVASPPQISGWTQGSVGRARIL